MAKAPAFQFYPGDWLRDTGLQRCSLSARGLWIQLLCLMHDGVPYGHLATAQGPILEPRMIARLVGGTVAEVKRSLAELESGEVFSRTDRGGLYSRRMVRDHALRQQRAEWGKLSIGHPLTHPPRVPSPVPFAPPPASSSASASASASSVAKQHPNPDSDGFSAMRLGQLTAKIGRLP